MSVQVTEPWFRHGGKTSPRDRAICRRSGWSPTDSATMRAARLFTSLGRLLDRPGMIPPYPPPRRRQARPGSNYSPATWVGSGSRIIKWVKAARWTTGGSGPRSHGTKPAAGHQRRRPRRRPTRPGRYQHPGTEVGRHTMAAACMPPFDNSDWNGTHHRRRPPVPPLRRSETGGRFASGRRKPGRSMRRVNRSASHSAPPCRPLSASRGMDGGGRSSRGPAAQAAL
jgi:hypothetical protein